MSPPFPSRYGPRAPHDIRSHILAFGDLSVDDCMTLWIKCDCGEEGKECSSTPSQGECTRGACADLFGSFNAQLLYFCPPWVPPRDAESPPRQNKSRHKQRR